MRTTGPRAKDVYIRQTTSAHVTTVMHHLFIGQKPMLRLYGIVIK